MSNYFLLRGRRALLKEVWGAWLSLTVGALLFGIVAACLAPRIGRDAAFAASLTLAAPVATMLLLSVRGGRVTLPSILKIPKGKPAFELEAGVDFVVMASCLKSLDPETCAELKYISSLLGANTLALQIHIPCANEGMATVSPQIEEKSASLLDDEALFNGPEEFTIDVGGETKRVVIVEVDKAKRMIFYSLRSEGGEKKRIVIVEAEKSKRRIFYPLQSEVGSLG